MDPATLTLYIAYAMVGIFALVAFIIVLYSEYQKQSQIKHKHA